MFGTLKKLWHRLLVRPSSHERLSPLANPVERQIPLAHSPVELSITAKHYVLPLRWSLYYALTKAQWRNLRERHRKLYPDWAQCSCPKRCQADSLDEKWEYNHETHSKIFVGAKFICRGCHWLKSPPWRIKTWVRQQNGLLLPTSKPAHIIDCLGWSQERVDALREEDLKEHRAQVAVLSQLEEQVQAGKAAILPLPVEQLTPQQVARLAKPGQSLIIPWRVDLTNLTRYGYTGEEIAAFEELMYNVARERMFPGGAPFTRRRT